MFEYFEDLDGELYRRWQTVECDIRSASSSFFASYRSLIECFIKTALKESDCDIKATDNIGPLMRRDEVREYFVGALRVSESTFEKTSDRILKINRSVHKLQKDCTLEQVASYLDTLYDLTFTYALSKRLDPAPPRRAEIEKLFNSHENEVNEVRKQGEKNSRDILNDLKAHIDGKFDAIEDELDSLRAAKEAEEKAQRYAAQEEQIILEAKERRKRLQSLCDDETASAYNLYVDFNDSFREKRKALIILTLISIGIALITTTLTTVALGFYSTFTLMLNIWDILVILLLYKLLKAKPTMPSLSFASLTPLDNVELINYTHPFSSLKTRYLVLLIIASVGALGDATVPFWSENLVSAACAYISTFLLVGKAVLSYIIYFKCRSFYENYSIFIAFRSNKRTNPDGTQESCVMLLETKEVFEESYFVNHFCNGRAIKY